MQGYLWGMEAARLRRIRWRLRGAWLWPAFVVLGLVDAVIGHLLPLQGDSQSLVGAWLVASFAMLTGIAVAAPLLARAIGRRRTEMPRVVARDYAGTLVIVAISAALLAAGLIHHRAVLDGREALASALHRAQAWIAHHAPPEFRSALVASVWALQPGSVYRACVWGAGGAHAYCVVVRLEQPAGRSVSYSGAEPNSVLSAGT